MDEFELSLYKEITQLKTGKHENVVLVQHAQNDKIFVKKTLTNYNKKVYVQIKDNPHDNISKVIDTFNIDNQFVVIEEYINGETLDELVEKCGTIPEEIVKDIVLDICEGLEHMHSLSPPVIHRDIKPNNIVMSNDGVLKIIDFNASRLYTATSTQDTVAFGTYGYAAPEQYGFAESDARSDIYSLGILMNYMLTAEHPRDNMHQGKFKYIIEKCINISPEHRYANIEEFKRAFGVENSKCKTQYGTQKNNEYGSYQAEKEQAYTQQTYRQQVDWQEEQIHNEQNFYEHESREHSYNTQQYNNVEYSHDMNYETYESTTEIYKYPEDSITLPGFRSGVWWKQIIGAFGYLVAIGVILEGESSHTNIILHYLDNIAATCMYLGLIFLYTNYMNIQARLPLFNSGKRKQGYFVFSLVVMFGCATAILLVEGLFNIFI